MGGIWWVHTVPALTIIPMVSCAVFPGINNILGPLPCIVALGTLGPFVVDWASNLTEAGSVNDGRQPKVFRSALTGESRESALQH